LDVRVVQEKMRRKAQPDEEVDPLELIMKLKKEGPLKDLDFSYVIYPEQQVLDPSPED
jgi:hypothetical protein